MRGSLQLGLLRQAPIALLLARVLGRERLACLALGLKALSLLLVALGGRGGVGGEREKDERGGRW